MWRYKRRKTNRVERSGEEQWSKCLHGEIVVEKNEGRLRVTAKARESRGTGEKRGEKRSGSFEQPSQSLSKSETEDE